MLTFIYQKWDLGSNSWLGSFDHTITDLYLSSGKLTALISLKLKPGKYRIYRANYQYSDADGNHWLSGMLDVPPVEFFVGEWRKIRDIGSMLLKEPLKQP